MNESFWKKKRIIVEIILADIFAFFALQYFGIPDKYDYFIYWILGIILVVSLFLYLKFIVRELKEILNKKDNEG